MRHLRYTVLFVILSALWGCIKEVPQECPIDYTFYLKVVDSQGNDITSDGEVENAEIYVYGKKGTLLRMIPLTGDQIKERTPIKVTSEVLNISAWGNVNGNQIILLDNSSQPGSELRLISDADGAAQASDDLFWGCDQLTRTDVAQGVKNEVVISRKVSRMIVTVIGLEPEAGNNGYGFTIDQQYDGYTFMGIPTLKDIKTAAAGQFNARGEFVTQAPINLIHSPQGVQGGVKVRLSDSSGRELAVAVKDRNGNPITPIADKTINVLIDLSAGISIEVEVTPWDEIFQWIEY